ncbi:MAG: hypothetical protein V1899_10405, partial [Planctomycetota bacterium]
AFSGFRFDRVCGTLYLAPQISVRPFRIFFSTESGYGLAILEKQVLRIRMVEGTLDLKEIHIRLNKKEIRKFVNIRASEKEICIKLPQAATRSIS